jgi:uncharacterized protein YbaP (TraB family)
LHVLALLVAVVISLFTARAAAAAPPACAGRDMLAELQAADSAAYERVLAAASATSNARAILWRIEGKQRPPSYLFGTVHLTDDRVNALSERVRAALDGASRIALEVSNLSQQSVAAAMAALGKLVAFDQPSLDKLLSGEEFETARSALVTMGVPSEAVAVLRPWVVTMSLAMTACERTRAAAGLLPLDMRIAEHGKRRKIPVVGLETLEAQLRALAALSEGEQLQILKVTLKYYDRADDLMETMVQRYLARDLGTIWPFQIELARKAGYPADAFTAFERQMVGVRNAAMRDAALPLLKEGGVFIAVGALHLPGKQGLVTLFQNAGYTLVPVE